MAGELTSNGLARGIALVNSSGAQPVSAPVNLSAPLITGTTTEGQSLSGSQGTWSNTPTSYTYQWRRNGSPISAATLQAYTLVLADVGATITYTVTATNAGGSTSATSAGVGPVAALPVVTEIAWTPAMMGLQSLYRADVPSSILNVAGTQAVNSDPVETWQDQISGNHLVSKAGSDAVSTAATRPVYNTAAALNGVTPIRFNSGVLTNRLNQTNLVSLTNDYTLLAVKFVRPPATAVARVSIGSSQGSFNFHLQISDATVQGRVTVGSLTGTVETNTSPAFRFHAQSKAAANTNFFGRNNGAETLSPAGVGFAVAARKLSVGNAYNGGSIGADEDWFAFGTYAGILSRANEQRWEGYWAHLLGQQATLPADHPYKSVPPMVPTGTTSTVSWVDANFVPSTARQTFIGDQVELQADSYDGLVATDPPIDGTSQIWGFPYSLTTPERARFKAEWFPGNGTRYMFLRFPLGFAYRGVRDTVSGLGTTIGERFAGQNASITDMLSNVSAAGGGLIPEYWSPAPYWKTNSAYGGGAGQSGANPSIATLWAGGAYARTVTLDSIRVSDPTGYAAQINLLTNAMLNDLEYLHANVAPVRGFGLQNEFDNPTNDSYGHCTYTIPMYVDVLSSIIPKIRASTPLATWGGQPNTVLVHATSRSSIPSEINTAPIYSEIAYTTQHRIPDLGAAAPGVKGDADYAKSNMTSWLNSSLDKEVADNEFEYFYDVNDDPWTTANTILVQANFMRLGKARTHNPMIHIAKPIGQTSQSSNTKGYGVVAARLPVPFSQDPSTPGDPFPAVGHGEYITQPINGNAVKSFADNIKVGAKIMPSAATVAAGQQVVPFVNADGKRGYMLVNRNTVDWTATVGFGKALTASVKRYSLTDDGVAVSTISAASAASLTVPANSALSVLEQ